ncbi:MAG: glycosyltransferase [Pseudomonadota bacterium]
MDKSVVAAPPLWTRAQKPRTGALRIGVDAPSYGLEKVSYALAPEGVHYTKLSSLPIHRLARGEGPLRVCRALIGPRQDLVHTFNHIIVNRPFVVSFESELPRFLGDPSDATLRLGFRLLAARRCRAVLALSEAAAHAARLRMEALGVTGIADKMQVFRGGITVPESLSVPHPDKAHGPIHAAFVGSNSIRKGIEATLHAARALRDAGVDVRLTAICRSQSRTYCAPMEHDGDAIIADLAAEPWVTHYPALPNAEVLRLLHRAHLLFFPSIDESLGWVAVEAGLCGAARAVSNSFALPELVSHGEDGWIAPLPLRPDRRWQLLATEAGAEAWAKTQADLGHALARDILASGSTPAQLTEMGQAARRSMTALYGRANAARRLRALYLSATMRH